MSSCPAAQTAARTWSRSVTSRGWDRALPPASVIRPDVRRSPVPSRSAQCTVAPASASSSALARPMPLAAPVMNAARPVRSYAERGMTGPYDRV